MRELQSIQEDPIEGFKMLHVDDSNIFDWQIAIFGPPGTAYAGGYFKAHIRFPGDYPFSAPSFRFLTKIWHPNIYENGEVCISILHPPIDDPQGGELPGERWNPTQSVRTVLISIISMLNEPNTYSPANVDASVAFRNWKEGKDNKYKEVISKQIADSQTEALRDGVRIPMTESEYCLKPRASSVLVFKLTFIYLFCYDCIKNQKKIMNWILIWTMTTTRKMMSCILMRKCTHAPRQMYLVTPSTC